MDNRRARDVRLFRGLLLLMCLIYLLLFASVAAAEIYLMILVGGEIGAFNTIMLLVLSMVVGANYAKRLGIDSMRRMQAAMSQGIAPNESATDPLIIMLGGALLAVPGFLSDVAGITMLVPATRKLWKRAFAAWVSSKIRRPPPQQPRNEDSRIIDV